MCRGQLSARQPRWVDSVAWGALVLYLGVLARFTLWPEASQRPVWRQINAGSRAASSGRIGMHDTEMLANIALFIPFGVLAALLSRRVLVALASALVLSGSIELAQHWWLPSRDGSVRDVALNVLGAAVGCMIWVAAGACWRIVLSSGSRRRQVGPVDRGGPRAT